LLIVFIRDRGTDLSYYRSALVTSNIYFDSGTLLSQLL